MDLIRAGKSKVMTLRNFVQLNSWTGFTCTCTHSFQCRCVGQNTELKRASESCYFLWIWEITNSINYFLAVVMQRGILAALVLIRCSRHLFWRTLFSHFMIERTEVTEIMVLFSANWDPSIYFLFSYGDILPWSSGLFPLWNLASCEIPLLICFNFNSWHVVIFLIHDYNNNETRLRENFLKDSSQANLTPNMRVWFYIQSRVTLNISLMRSFKI